MLAKIDQNRENFLLPNPSASSKTKLAAFKIFSINLKVVKYFWPCSNMQIYKVKYHFWPLSKNFERVQKILHTVKKIWAWSKYFWTSRWNRHKSFLPIQMICFWKTLIPWIKIWSNLCGKKESVFFLCNFSCGQKLNGT